jgi:beta-lactamase class A
MTALNRRSLLVAIGALLAASAQAEEPSTELLAYERETGGRIGVYAHDVKTGRTLAWRADERFVMCSTFKMSLVACMLRHVDRGEERLDRLIRYGAKDLVGYAPTARANLSRGSLSVAKMCQAAVELSDNTCANLLLARIGGPPAMTAFWRSIGDPVTRLDHYELELNRSRPGNPQDTTTPAAMAANLRRVLLGEILSPASRERLTAWMLGCRTGANRMRAGLPADWRIGDKTGNNGHDAAGDIAVAWASADRPILVCVYTQGGSPTPAQLTHVFTAVGRRIGQELA